MASKELMLNEKEDYSLQISHVPKELCSPDCFFSKPLAYGTCFKRKHLHNSIDCKWTEKADLSLRTDCGLHLAVVSMTAGYVI